MLCNLSHPSPAPPNQFKEKPSPSSWPCPLRYSEAFSNPWDREGRLVTREQGKQQGPAKSEERRPPVWELKGAPTLPPNPHILRSIMRKRERTKEGGNLSFGVKGARGREQQELGQVHRGVGDRGAM